jgi:pyruvate kinase
VRHTKIVATLGPCSSSDDTIAALILAGVDVFRLNFSHGNVETHQETIRRVRRASESVSREVAILQDLSGLKIRTGPLEGSASIALNAADRLDITLGSGPGRTGSVTTTYEPLFRALSPRARLLLDDGRIELEVEDVSADRIVTRVLDGGELGEHKGINAPNVPLPPVGLTEKDEADLRAGLRAGVDLVAISFVQSATDIARARSVTADAGRPDVPLVAKLERPEAIQRLDEIAEAADALMIARGDLGLELPLEAVPRVQKKVLRLGLDRGVPVIVATQVLESMRTESRPTRAEVSDAAGAVDGGAAAIMLSGETAIGDHPVRTVEVLDSIIRQAELFPGVTQLQPQTPERVSEQLGSLCDAAVTLAARAKADAIVALTRQGRTARALSGRRPAAPVYAATNDPSLVRSLCLWWGIQPILDPLEGDADAVAARIVGALREKAQLVTPATIVIVSANPDLTQTGVNFVALRQLP